MIYSAGADQVTALNTLTIWGERIHRSPASEEFISLGGSWIFKQFVGIQNGMFRG